MVDDVPEPVASGWDGRPFLFLGLPKTFVNKFSSIVDSVICVVSFVQSKIGQMSPTERNIQLLMNIES